MFWRFIKQPTVVRLLAASWRFSNLYTGGKLFLFPMNFGSHRGLSATLCVWVSRWQSSLQLGSSACGQRTRSDSQHVQKACQLLLRHWMNSLDHWRIAVKRTLSFGWRECVSCPNPTYGVWQMYSKQQTAA